MDYNELVERKRRLLSAQVGEYVALNADARRAATLSVGAAAGAFTISLAEAAPLSVVIVSGLVALAAQLIAYLAEKRAREFSRQYRKLGKGNGND